MKNFFSENNLLKLIVLLPMSSIILAAIVLTNIFLSTEKANYAQEIKELKQEHITNIKTIIKDRIERTIKILRTKNRLHEQDNKEEMRNIVLMGYKLMESIQDEYGKYGKEKVIEEIKHSLRNIRFYTNNSGYFFVYDLQGNNILLPPKPSLEGKNLLHIKDSKGKAIVSDAVKLLKTTNEVFDTWYWWKKDGKELIQKLGFYKKYEPLNLFIGTGKYYDDIQTENLKSSFQLLAGITYKGGDYIFAVNDEATVVVHKNPDILNKSFEKLPKAEQKIAIEMLKQGKNKDGAFLEYTPTTQKNKRFPSQKISYVKYIPELQITLGTGLYTNELNKKLQNKEKALKEKLTDTINQIIISSVVVTFILILIMLFFANSLKRIFNEYSKKLEQHNQELKQLNNSLEARVQKELKKNQEQNEILHQQSKMAAMGEMLGNIAHQWRQPLSAISTAASGIKFQDNLQTLDKKLMHEGLDSIVKNTKTLSQTIDDFRNFFSTQKDLNTFELNNCYKKVLSLISANLKNQDITLVEKIDDITLVSYENELVQVLLNLINNARDALLDSTKEKIIVVSAYEKDEIVTITIQDNGVGINQEILAKVFDPYFTTKHQSQGTGIGLYMTQKIVVSSLQGEITIKNSNFIHDGKGYLGALCTIKLPKQLTTSS